MHTRTPAPRGPRAGGVCSSWADMGRGTVPGHRESLLCVCIYICPPSSLWCSGGAPWCSPKNKSLPLVWEVLCWQNSPAARACCLLVATLSTSPPCLPSTPHQNSGPGLRPMCWAGSRAEGLDLWGELGWGLCLCYQAAPMGLGQSWIPRGSELGLRHPAPPSVPLLHSAVLPPLRGGGRREAASCLSLVFSQGREFVGLSWSRRATPPAAVGVSALPPGCWGRSGNCSEYFV